MFMSEYSHKSCYDDVMTYVELGLEEIGLTAAALVQLVLSRQLVTCSQQRRVLVM